MSDLSAELGTVREQPVTVVKAVIEQVREDDVPFMAGSIAYQAFASLIPMLVLLFLVVAVLGDEQLAQRVVALTEGVFPASAQELLRNSIASRDGVGSAGASIIGVVTLLWGSLKIFRGLDKAFSEIYETDARNSFVDQLRDGFIVFVALGLGVIGMVGALVVFGVYSGPLSWVLTNLVLVGILAAAFLPMYRFFPDSDLSWSDALPGALFAAVGWVILQFLFQLYVGFAGRGDSSGVIGAVLLLLLWLYLSGLLVLLAAVVNAVLLGDGGPTPKTGTEAETPAREL